MQGLMNGLGVLSGQYGQDIRNLGKVLIGTTVTEIRVKPGEASLALVTKDGVCALDTDADCCSETWFADILGVQHLLNHEINELEFLDLPRPDDGRSRQEEDQAYGLRLTTAAGVCDIIFRNSSNGYYGGWANLAQEAPDIEGWRVITDDWQA